MFSKRHYELLAKFFNREVALAAMAPDNPDENRLGTCQGLARLLASELERDNPRFDRAKFLAAVNKA